MDLAATLAAFLEKGIGNTTHGYHALPVVLQAGTHVLDKSSYTGGIITTLPSVHGINLIKITPGPDILMMLASPSLLCRRGGTSRGIPSIPFVHHSYLGAAHFFIFDVGVGYATAFLIFSSHSPSFTRVYAVSFRNKSSFRILVLITAPFPSIHLTSGAAPPSLATTVPGSLRFLLKLGVWIGISRMIPPCVSSLLPLMCLLHNRSGRASGVPKKAGVRIKVLSSKHT